MTFKEALAKRTEIGETHIHEGEVYFTVIAPKLEKEYIKFIAQYKSSSLDDNEIESLSSDGQFKIIGILKEAGNIYTLNL